MEGCLRRAFVLVGALSVLATQSVAQQAAAIGGVVSDQTGAALSGATVELLSGPGASRFATCDGAGRYRLGGLALGEYTDQA